MTNQIRKLAKKAKRRRAVPRKKKNPNVRLIRTREQFFENPHQAAAALGIPYATYIQYENGTRSLSKPAASRIAGSFGTTAGYLLYGDPVAEPSASNDSFVTKHSDVSVSLTVDLVYFRRIVDGLYPSGQIRKMLADIELPIRAYSVEMPDRSMIPDDHAAIHRWPVILEGNRVVFDPDAMIRPDDVVHAVLALRKDSVIRILRRYKAADGKVRSRLIPLNGAFEEIDLDEAKGDYLVGKYYTQLPKP